MENISAASGDHTEDVKPTHTQPKNAEVEKQISKSAAVTVASGEPAPKEIQQILVEEPPGKSVKLALQAIATLMPVKLGPLKSDGLTESIESAEKERELLKSRKDESAPESRAILATAAAAAADQQALTSKPLTFPLPPTAATGQDESEVGVWAPMERPKCSAIGEFNTLLKTKRSWLDDTAE